MPVLSSMSQELQIEHKELKTRFAEALLKTPDDPFTAAFSVEGDAGMAMQIANLWVRDPFVCSEKLRLLEENGARAFLPSKEEQAKDIYKMANDITLDEEIRLKAHRLYAELMGHIEKAPGNAINVLNQGVMIVRDQGSNEDWEAKALEQQRTLIGNAANAN